MADIPSEEPRKRTTRKRGPAAGKATPPPIEISGQPEAPATTNNDEKPARRRSARPRTTTAKTGTKAEAKTGVEKPAPKPAAATRRKSTGAAGSGRRGAHSGKRSQRELSPSLSQRVARMIRHPLALLALAVLVTAGLGYGTTRLTTDASAGLLMNTASNADQVTFANTFGADPVVVMAEPTGGKQLLTPEHMVGLAQLEGQLAGMSGVKRVYGPGTLVNTFASEVTKRALDLCGSQGKQAESAAIAQAKAEGKSSTDQQTAGQQAFQAAVQQCAQQLAAQYPTLSSPALNNPAFFNELLLDQNGSVRPYWRSVLPAPGRALLTVRMAPNASLDDVLAVQRAAETATSGPMSKTQTNGQGQAVKTPTPAANLAGLRLTVSGTPVLMADLGQSVRQSLRVLLPAALLLMLLLTGLVLWRLRYRLLAVPLAAVAGVWTAGAAAWLGLPLTPATLAALPVVLGLTTDYVLQATNRLAEEEGAGGERIASTLRAILPATATAAVATTVGVLAFAISPIPLIRQFGLFLALGVVMSWLTAMLVGFPILRLLADHLPGKARPAPSWGFLARAARLPLPALVPLIVAGLAGWAALPFIHVQTDPIQLLPPGASSLSNARLVASRVGSSGELDLVVTGPDVTSPEVVAWMGATEEKLQGKRLTPITGLPDFVLAFNYGKAPDAKTTKTILDRLPSYFTGAVVSPDRHSAVIVFGQRGGVQSVEKDQELVSRVNAAAASVPHGYRAYPAGLAVIAAAALDRLRQDQVILNVAALVVVLVALMVAFRRPLPALLAVVPTAVAAGWVSGAVFLTHTQASPITVLLSGVVVAFATEFGVLWLARYRSELNAGTEPDDAAAIACRRIGPAIVAAAAALIAGFAALAISPVPMVRDFGLWCAADLALATAAVLVVLPPAARRLLRR